MSVKDLFSSHEIKRLVMQAPSSVPHPLGSASAWLAQYPTLGDLDTLSVGGFSPPVGQFQPLSGISPWSADPAAVSPPIDAAADCGMCDDEPDEDAEDHDEQHDDGDDDDDDDDACSADSGIRMQFNPAYKRAYARGKRAAASSSRPRQALSARGGRPTQEVLDARRRDSVNDALQGQNMKGKQHSLKQCSHPVQIGDGFCPCYTNLWATGPGDTGKDELETHMRKWLSYTEAGRKAALVSQLREAYNRETNEWKLVVRGRSVCRHVFELYYPISTGQLTNIQKMIIHGLDEREGGDSDEVEAEANPRDPLGCGGKKATAVAGWLLGFFEEIGDRVGCLAEGSNEDTLIIPRMEKKMVWEEYKAAEGEDAASESLFMQTWRTHPLLAHVQMARKIRNFQLCTTCHRINEGITAAHKAHKTTELEKWRKIRREHHSLQRGERLSYYKRRREAASDLSGEEYLSIILDKWDSAKTTVPFWAREPSFLGAQEKHQMLQQHVLGVIVHGQPHTYYLYTFNDNLKGDANMNIEGIRRTLLKHLEGGRHMPRILYVQADNASDNKNFAMIAFLALLVFHGYVEEVQLSFLIVGHTHEDIDQFFSVLTKHLMNLKVVKTPQAFQTEIEKASSGKRRKVVARTVDAVLNWTDALKPFSNQTIAGIQRATFNVDEDVKEVRSPHVFRFTLRQDGMVAMHYKEFHCHQVWLPPRNPDSPADEWVTDPSGIELFSASNPPPDLTRIPIQVAPYVTS